MNMFSSLSKNFYFFESNKFVSPWKEDIIKEISIAEKFDDPEKCILSLQKALTLIINDIIKKNKDKFKKDIDMNKSGLADKIKFISTEVGPDTSTYIFSMMYEINNARNYESHKYDKEKHLNFKWTKFDVVTKLKNIFVICKFFYSDIIEQTYFDESEYFKHYKNDSIEAIDEETRNKIKKEYINLSSLRINGDAIRGWLSIKNSKLVVPIYQRKYEWEPQNIEILLHDILARMEDDGDHYFGTIAQKRQVGENNNDPNIIKIIDGQQRITTSLLIVCASLNVLVNKLNKEKNEIDWYVDLTKHHNNPNNLGEYIYNPGGSASENETFRNILENKMTIEELEKSKSKYAINYLIIYKFILEKFKSHYGIYNFINTFLNKFSVASISFDQEKFSNKKEMEVFENLNSKGLELTNVDLIKNHLLNYCDDNTLNKKEREVAQEYNLAIQDFKDNDDIETFYLTLSELYRGDEIKKDKRTRFSIIRESLDEYLKNYKIIHNFNGYKDMISYLKEYINLYNEILSGKYNFIKFIKCEDVFDVISDKNKKRLFSYFVFIIFNILTRKNKYKFENFDNQNIFINKEEIKYIQALFLEICKFLIKTKVITKQGDSNIKRVLMKIAKENLNLSKNKSASIQDICKKIIKEIKEANSTEQYSFAKFKASLENNTNHNSIIELFALTEKIMSKSLFNENEWTARSNRTIEHILPQEWKEWSKEISNDEQRKNFEENVDINKEKIGNYLILTSKQNSKNKNFVFLDKKSKVFKDLISPLYKNDNDDIDISRKTEWNFEYIDKRTRALIDYIIKNVITE